MRKAGKKREQAKNKALAQYRLKRIPDQEDPHEADDTAIPDYVMWDFGFAEERRDSLDGQRRVHGTRRTTVGRKAEGSK